MRKVVIPPSPGVFSAAGLLHAEVEHHYSRSFRRLLAGLDIAELSGAWQALEDEASAQLARDGFTGDSARCLREAALHYQGQTFDLLVPLPDGSLTGETLAYLAEAFGAEHERTYGHRAGPEEPVELVSIRVIGQGIGARAPLPQLRATRGTCRAQDHPPSLLRAGAGLARDPDPGPRRPRRPPHGTAHHRGV